jgi:hypothetical protein
VRVAQGNYIEMADAARPQHRRNYLLADVEILDELAWATTESPSINQHRFPFRRYQQQGIALPYINGFNDEGVMWMINRPRHYHYHHSEKHRRACGPSQPARLREIASARKDK